MRMRHPIDLERNGFKGKLVRLPYVLEGRNKSLERRVSQPASCLGTTTQVNTLRGSDSHAQGRGIVAQVPD